MASVTWNPGISSSNPTIVLTVNQGSQSVSNNTTSVSWSLVLYRPSSVNSTANKPYTVTIDGTTVASGSTSINGSGTKTIASGTRTIAHNSAGAKTLSFSFTVTVMPLYWSGKATGNASGSGSMTLTTIPRASTLNSFSIGSSLQISTANTVRLGITRASPSFTHDIQLRDGTTALQSWNGQGVPTSLTISASVVNTLLSRMSSVTSRTLTLVVQTKSGSTNIGSALTRTATVSVHSNVTPTATGLKVSVYGSGRDKTINKFVQNISRVTSSFTGSARGGASVSSRSIVIRRVSGGSNSQTISSGSGTTGVVTLNGSYEAIATVKDSRGRTATQRITFTVEAYSPPRITSFTAVRNSTKPTEVNIGRYGSWSALGGSNSITIIIKRGSTELQNVGGATGSISGTLTSTGNEVTSSYSFSVVATDQFGNSAQSSVSVSTQKVLFDLHKNEGVGIGKVHERGALDVGGTAYFDKIQGSIGVPDTRSVIDAPNGITDRAFGLAFKLRSSVGNPPLSASASSTYAWVWQVAGWDTNGGSGGWPMEISLGNTAIAIRQATSATTWGAWSLVGGSSSVAWGSVTGKPSTFPPSSHTHAYASTSHTHSSFASSLTINNGTTGGWARGYNVKNGTSSSMSFGAYGSGNTLSYGYIGTEYNTAIFRIYPSAVSYPLVLDDNAGASSEATLRPTTSNRCNVGTTSYLFDVIRGRVVAGSSDRNIKENIETFDEDEAYEQIKSMPLYSFSFEHDQFVDHNIGTMIEYMPIDLIETGKNTEEPGNENTYSLSSTIFYAIGALKVAQRKINVLEEENEELKIRLSRLEDIIFGEEE